MPSDLFSFSAIILAVYYGLSLGMFARWWRTVTTVCRCQVSVSRAFSRKRKPGGVRQAVVSQTYRVYIPVFCIKNHQPNHLPSKMESPTLSNLRNTQRGIIDNFPSRAYINIMWTIHFSLQFCQIKGKPSLFSHFLLKTFGWYEKNPYLCIRFWERTLLQNSY